MLKNLPIGIQTFERIRTDNYFYVDKTSYVYDLVHSGTQYFLSRPRRFGKSLLVSTLESYWSGKKELFQGLAIDGLEKDNADAWKEYPVFHFDFDKDNFRLHGALEKVLERHLEKWEKDYGCTKSNDTLSGRFQNLIEIAHEKSGLRCVVLVDEYDKPLLSVMDDKELEEHNKEVFKGFYTTLKSYEKYIQFAFITGVTKFSKVSIFSDLNHLNDISMNRKYAGICGITETEVKENLSEYIQEMAEILEISYGECMEELKKKYDGYHFFQNTEGVYNPFSLINALSAQNLASYWFETGTPTFLVKKIKEEAMDIRSIANHELYATDRYLSNYKGDDTDPVPLLYQTGYLSIADYNKKENFYTLGFPNEEVKYGFLECLLPEYVGSDGSGTGKDILSLRRYLRSGNLESLKNALTALFAGIPYSANDAPFEHYFQTVIYLVFTLLGQYVHVEQHTYTGRIDCIVETDDYIYLFEFKRDGSADEALAQITEKGYALPYAADPRKLYKIGVSFNSASRMLEEWKEE